MYRKNTAGQNLPFALVNASSGAALTGATVTARRSIDGAAQASATGTVAELANGQYNLALSQADTNGNQVGILLTATGAIPVHFSLVTTAADPTDTVRFGLTALPNAVAGANTGLPTVDASNAVKVQSGTAANQISLTAGLVTAGTVATGAITTASFAAGAIDAAAIATDAIGSAELATSAVTEIQAAVAAGSVASVVGAVGSVTGNVGGNVTGSVGSVAAAGIATTSFAAGAINAAAIATDAITSTQIAAGAIGATEIADGAIDAATFATGAITAATFATNAVNAAALATDAVTEIQAAVAAGAVASVTAAVTVGTNNDKTGYALTAGERTAIADGLLDRNLGTGTDSGSATVRTVRQALRALRNRFGIVGTTRSVYKEDDATVDWTSTVTTSASADPITADDPAGP